MAQPYNDLKEWEVDLNRVRANPNDGHLMQHVRLRVLASPTEIQKQVHEYLQDVAFSNNPVPMGQLLAKRSEKYFYQKSAKDPWWNA